MNRPAPFLRCLPALRPCVRGYASRPRPRLADTLSLEHVSYCHPSRDLEMVSNLPSQLSSSKGPESWPCTATSSGQHAGSRTRPPVPRQEAWLAPSLRETAMSQTLFVFLFPTRLLNFPCVPFATNAGLLSLTHKDHIRYLLSTGKTEWENMERYIDGL